MKKIILSIILPLVSLSLLIGGYCLYSYKTKGVVEAPRLVTSFAPKFVQKIIPALEEKPSPATSESKVEGVKWDEGNELADLSLEEIEELIREDDVYTKLNQKDLDQADRAGFGKILDARATVLEAKIRSDMETLNAELELLTKD